MEAVPLTLQGKIMCWCEKDGHTSGYWQFAFNGQMSSLIQRMDTGQSFILEGNRWERSGRRTELWPTSSRRSPWETVGPGFRISWCAGRKCWRPWVSEMRRSGSPLKGTWTHPSVCVSVCLWKWFIQGESFLGEQWPWGCSVILFPLPPPDISPSQHRPLNHCTWILADP